MKQSKKDLTTSKTKKNKTQIKQTQSKRQYDKKTYYMAESASEPHGYSLLGHIQKPFIDQACSAGYWPRSFLR